MRGSRIDGLLPSPRMGVGLTPTRTPHVGVLGLTPTTFTPLVGVLGLTPILTPRGSRIHSHTHPSEYGSALVTAFVTCNDIYPFGVVTF
jgi:hypothetical protein